MPGDSWKAAGEDRRKWACLCGRMEFGGVVRTACLDLLPEANVGDYLLVHVGFAISRIDEEEAKATLAYLEELGELQAELGAVEKWPAMKHLDEYRDGKLARTLVERLAAADGNQTMGADGGLRRPNSYSGSLWD